MIHIATGFSKNYNMTLDDVLGDLIFRVSPKDNGTVSWEQIRQWPKEAVEIFQNAGWITAKEPATTVVCPGCEENCFMPVHVRKRDDGVIHARVMCDRLDYMGPVPIHSHHLKQWQITGKQVAEWFARQLGIKTKPKKIKETGNFIIGSVQGKKKTGCLELTGAMPVSIKVSENSLPLREIVYFENNKIQIDQKAIFSMVDKPPLFFRAKV